MTNTLINPTLGLQSWQQNEGSSPTAGMTPVWIASTDASLIFRGDPVVPSSSPGANNSGRYITAPGSGNTVLLAGVFQGCYQFQPSAGRIVWSNSYLGTVSGSTGDIKAYVIDNPDQLFLAQGSTGAAIGSSQIGWGIGFTANSSTGNQTTGYSNVALQSTTTGSTSTFPLRIVDFYSAFAPGGGAFGNVHFNSSVTGGVINGLDNSNPANIVLVRMNNCERLNLTSRSTS
jgi:hypothetical protein